MTSSLPGCPALPPVPPLESALTKVPSKRGLRAAESVRGAPASLSTPPTTYGPIPGLVSASGELGSLFGRGYDPVASESKGAISEWHYDGWACKGDSSKCSVDDESTLNTWFDPSSGLAFRKPDEIELFNTPSSNTEGGFKLFLNSTVYTNWHFSSHSTSIGLGFFNYAHMDSDTHLTQPLNTNQVTLAIKNRHVITYQMSMWGSKVLSCQMRGMCAQGTSEEQPGTQQNSSFAMQRDALPSTCASGTDDANQYSLFRQNYGTHYVESAIYGGSLQFIMVINNTLYNKMSQEEVMSQTSFGFDLIYVSFGMFHGTSKQTRDVTTIFRQNTKVVLLSSGGNSLLLQEQNFPKWSKSINTNPAPIKVQFRNVTNLFDNPAQKQCMQSEVDAYLQKKHTPQYRCGSAVGSTILPKGIPNPGKPGKSGKSTLGTTGLWMSLPTLQEANDAQQRRLLNDAADTVDAVDAVEAEAVKQPNRNPERSNELRRALVGTSCTNVIPGASSSGIIGKTFDILTGEPRLLATPFTCVKKKVWFSPYEQKTFQIPDQLDFIDVSASCAREQLTSITNDTDAWKSSASDFGFNVGIGIYGLKIGVGFSEQRRATRELLQNYTRQSTSLIRRMNMYRLSYGLSSDVPRAVGPQLRMALSRLPTIQGGYSKGTQAQKFLYDTFIKSFGTHYISGADFGAHCNFNTFLDQSYVSRKSTSFVSEQISITIGIQMKGIGIDVDFGYNETKFIMKQSAEFARHAINSTSCFGGDLTLLDQKPPQYDKWVESVYSAPSWINGTAVLRPLAELIVGNGAATKRGCLNDAVQNYLETTQIKR